MYSWSREKFFLIAFVAMFAYWWFPGFIFTALSYFNWINWIDPTNVTLGAICGSVNGLGVNPWPTFDFNNLTVQGWTPLVLPFFSIANQFFGMIIAFIMIVYWWFTNAYNTSYLPINSNKVFDNSGASYNVTKVLNAEGLFDNSKYQTYSQPWMAAGNLVIYFWFMAIYSCSTCRTRPKLTIAISYVIVYHRHEVGAGFKALWRSIRRQRQNTEEEDLAEDVHWRLMKAYPEVPEWWYMVSLVIAAALGMVGVGAWPTNTSVSVVIYGIVMALFAVIPVGLIAAVTGIQVTMNVLAEFIGGIMVSGNAIALNYFKMYGYVTTAHAIYFANDLKLAHYAKIPPKHTFMAQMAATFVSTLICTSVFNFQMGFANVCTSAAAFGFTCPGQNTFFTAAVFWGTLSPLRLFGPGRRYNVLLYGFPLGAALPIGKSPDSGIADVSTKTPATLFPASKVAPTSSPSHDLRRRSPLVSLQLWQLLARRPNYLAILDLCQETLHRLLVQVQLCSRRSLDGRYRCLGNCHLLCARDSGRQADLVGEYSVLRGMRGDCLSKTQGPVYWVLRRCSWHGQLHVNKKEKAERAALENGWNGASSLQ